MAKSSKAIPWFLFAGGGTVVAFLLPALLLITGLFSIFGFFGDALSYETMHAFVGNWLVKLIIFGVLVLILWHAAHRLRVVAHDFGIRADGIVAWVVYLLAGLGCIVTAIALIAV